MNEPPPAVSERPLRRTALSVREYVVMLLLSMVMLVAVVASAGAVGVTLLTDDVDVLVEDLRPAAYANITVRREMDRAHAGARGWVLTGQTQYRRDYRRRVAEIRSEIAVLKSLSGDDDELRSAVARQSRRAQEWITVADGLVAQKPGRAATVLFTDAEWIFARFSELNDEVAVQVNAGAHRRGHEAKERARDLIVFVVLVSLLGLAVTALMGRAIVRRVSGPLRDMEGAVARLADGDLSVRVSANGPREIRGVASALNTLAEENERAREMEQQVVRQLRRLDRAKDEFVSTVSHELRTPLTSIAGYIELFEDGFVELNPQQRGMLAVVRRNVGRLRALIEDLLTLSRVEASAFRTSFDVVDLGRVVSDAARDVTQIAARADVRVREVTPDGALQVRGDAGQLSRATLNLLSNAIKFSTRGSEVLVRLTETGGNAVVSVVDHGIGIPAEELPTLGTRFFRASNAVESEITGTGLGLRIVQTIVDNHGGRLELDSAQGQGTTARLVIPIVHAEDPRNIRPLQDITEG